MRLVYLPLILMALLSSPGHAEDNIYDIAKELGGLSKGANKSIEKPDQYVPRYTDNPPNTDKYYGTGMVLPTDMGKSKINDCRSIPIEDIYLRQECEGVNLVTQNESVRPEVSIDPKEKLVTGTQQIAGDPAETLEKYKWKIPFNEDGSVGDIPQTACQTETTEMPPVIKDRTCAEYTGADLVLCQAVLNVTVDPNFNYSCVETKYQNTTHTCSNKLTVVCETKPDCTTAGIKAGTIQSDMNVTFKKSGNSHELTFGTIGDDYWGAGQYDRSMTLELTGKSRLTEFMLTSVQYDDWLVVQVNGAIVFSDSPGNMIELKKVCSRWSAEERKCTQWGGRNGTICKNWVTIPPKCIGGTSNRVVIAGTENAIGWPERSTSWNKTLNVDVRPYLKDGKNTIFTRTIVGGRGESAAVFKAMQYCEPVCVDKWNNQCLAFENRK